ncbi:lantibiotic dehydratase family protein [Pedobacter heparinus]|uniref:lantibiotic dehydratase family protein n=1 Tax=Pedobacter heparinus TaxID=984 RepID=UPI00056C1755|nr:lantibiotic dehydratase family protein [Pedobacter heparinus]
MKKTNPYLPFEQFVYRSPLLPFNTFIQHLTEISASEERFKNLLSNKIIWEAIYLASPVLFEELLKYLQKGLPDKKEEERIKYSMVRYLGRMSTRCTPFGLFAGCSVGRFNEQTTIALNKTEQYQRHTRLDMTYLCALAQELAGSPEVKPYFRYFSNTSIYRFGDKIRYVEYFYRSTRRIHRISAVDYSEYLDKILREASQGRKINELAELIVDDEISMEDASAFIDELINSQLLVNEMEPSVTGKEFLYQAIQKFEEIEKTIPGKKEYISGSLQLLKQVSKVLEDIDKNVIGNTLHLYGDITSEIKRFKTTFEPKYLFQTDMIKPADTSFLGRDVIDDLKGAIEFFNKITAKPGETNLSKFREAFRDRYEDREMPLLQVLDNEAGIGYTQAGSTGDINPLVDDLMIPQPGSSNGNKVIWSGLQSILLKKYIEAKTTNQYTIELSDKEFEHLTTQWNDLPLTISAMFRIVQDDKNGRTVYMKTAGGSSAANLLGRFCYADKRIEEHVLDITQKEEELNPDVIFAEIAHLPESRTGNILLRPVLRPYEIPYLAKPGVEKDYQIALSDLMVSVRNGRILLRSKRLNKEIIPRLSSAHNYSFKAMPVYHFLCDMQVQNGRSAVGFNWGTLANEHNWLPRVKYIIIHFFGSKVDHKTRGN